MMSKSFTQQFTFQYDSRECECHYKAGYEVDRAEPQTHDYPGCPAYAHVNDIKLLFVETDEPILTPKINYDDEDGNPIVEAVFNGYKRLQIPDLPAALVVELEDRAWIDAQNKLDNGEVE
jgi:hypothetical protein